MEIGLETPLALDCTKSTVNPIKAHVAAVNIPPAAIDNLYHIDQIT